MCAGTYVCVCACVRACVCVFVCLHARARVCVIDCVACAGSKGANGERSSCALLHAL